jgi:hypothetical protein
MNTAHLSNKLIASTLVVLTIMLAGSAKGQSGDYDGFEWYSDDGYTAEITDYYGSGGAVAIPSFVIDDSDPNGA